MNFPIVRTSRNMYYCHCKRRPSPDRFSSYTSLCLSWDSFVPGRFPSVNWLLSIQPPSPAPQVLLDLRLRTPSGCATILAPDPRAGATWIGYMATLASCLSYITRRIVEGFVQAARPPAYALLGVVANHAFFSFFFLGTLGFYDVCQRLHFSSGSIVLS